MGAAAGRPAGADHPGWFLDGDIVLDVDDPFLGERGRYLLTVRDGKAGCVATDRESDLSLDISDLGSIYLGGTAPSTLVRAGHVRAHRPGAAALADATPSGDNGYKIELARRIAVRALTLARAGTPDRVPALPASPFSSPLKVAAHA